MVYDLNQIVTTAIEKAKVNPLFAQDLMKYVQYLTLSNFSQDKLPELKETLEKGNMKDLLEFGSQTVPEFEKKVAEYVNKY